MLNIKKKQENIDALSLRSAYKKLISIIQEPTGV